MRTLRYLAPNLVTTSNIVFGMLSLMYTARGEYDTAAWYIIYGVLGDVLDGLIARAVRGASELGVQLDSFADFLNFGLAPAFLVYHALGSSPLLPFTEGLGHALLLISCAVWALAATFRLARYNITPDDETPRMGGMRIFFGVPTTLAGGLLVTWFLTLYKYAPPGQVFPHLPEAFGGMRLFGDLQTPVGAWRYLPVAMVVGGYLMASTLRMPKLGVMPSRTASAVSFGLVAIGGVCGYARVFPEYMIWPPTLWLIGFLIWGQLSRAAKGMKPPPIFPPVDPPPQSAPVRPEDHLVPEGSEAGLDPVPSRSAESS
ncbi:CDP-alcohol phosphatidyltransferase family protein [Haliangium sp.]|uniref:CDP-alcohol phosphatidyltransferase family protein n=1 Tax=Haliangium sp. TaxID=2663208 RepID=UPI003D13D88E